LSTPAPAGRREPRLDPTELAASAMVTLLTVTTAIGFCRLFPDWAFLRPMLAVVVGTHAAATALRVLRVPGWLAVPAGLLIILELIAVVYYRDTIRWMLPSGETIDALRSDLRLVWEQFPSAVAPVPSEGSFAVAAAICLALCGLVADGFAFRAEGRAEAVVPTGLVFVFTAALGADRNRIAVSALWLATALATIAVLRFTHGRGDAVWVGRRRRTVGTLIPLAVVVAATAGIGAAVAAPLLPGAGEEALLDTRGRSDVTSVVSPLVDIRTRLVNRANLLLFTVDSPSPEYWRVSGLAEFDGTQWTPSDEDLTPASGQLTAPEPAVSPIALVHRVTIAEMTGNFLPVAYGPFRTRSPGLWWAPQSETLVVPDAGYSSGDAFDLVSGISRPTAEQLQEATVNGAPEGSLQLPGDLPDEVTELARQVTAGAATPYDEARALQDWFRSQFAYDLSVQAGHSNDAMRNFLRIRRGYCEQFAGTFAAMARAIGLPARVAVGYTPGEQRSAGRFYVAGRYSHAWAEVWFDGYGWVRFEPTPGRGAPGDENHTGVAAAQDPGDAGAGAADEAAPATTGPAVSVTVPNAGLDPELGTTTPVAGLGGSGRGDAGGSVLAWVMVAIGVGVFAWLVVVPRLARRLAARRGSTDERVSAAWQRSCQLLEMAGAPPVGGMTPTEFADEAERSTGVDRRVTAEVAGYVVRAVYSPDPIEDRAAARCEHLQLEIHELVRARLPWRQRLREHLDPREARWLHI
jgi:transglutaminase-like putative cysteine protease